MNRVFFLVTVLASCLLAACGPSGDGPSVEADGCGECVEELEVVRTDLEKLPGVLEILTVTRYADSPTNGAGVRVELRSEGSGETGVADSVAKVLWQSRVTPLEEVFVTVADSDGKLVPTRPYVFVPEVDGYASYVEKWGERPVE